MISLDLGPISIRMPHAFARRLAVGVGLVALALLVGACL